MTCYKINIQKLKALLSRNKQDLYGGGKKTCSFPKGHERILAQQTHPICLLRKKKHNKHYDKGISLPQIKFFNCGKYIEHKISYFSHFLAYRSVALITLTSLHNITIIHPQLQLLFSSSQTEPLGLLDPNFPFSPSSRLWVNVWSYIMIYVFLIFFSFFYCGKIHHYGNVTTSII